MKSGVVGDSRPALRQGTVGVNVSFVCDRPRVPHLWKASLVAEEQELWRSPGLQPVESLVSACLGTGRAHVPLRAICGRRCFFSALIRHGLRSCFSRGCYVIRCASVFSPGELVAWPLTGVLTSATGISRVLSGGPHPPLGLAMHTHPGRASLFYGSEEHQPGSAFPGDEPSHSPTVRT